MIGKRKDRGGGGAKKILPARGHCSFRKLCLPMNGVSDWCSLTLPVNCLSITANFISFVRERNMYMLVLINQIMMDKPSSAVVVCPLQTSCIHQIPLIRVLQIPLDSSGIISTCFKIPFETSCHFLAAMFFTSVLV